MDKHAQKELAHDPLHCHVCSANEKMLQALQFLVGINQAELSKLDSFYGVPRGSIFQFSQSSPAQNTNYQSSGTPFDGVFNGFTISGAAGDVTVSIQNEFLPGGSLAVGTFTINGTATISHHIAVPVNSQITLKTTAAASTNLSFSAWLEPIMMNNSEFFRMRR